MLLYQLSIGLLILQQVSPRYIIRRVNVDVNVEVNNNYDGTKDSRKQNNFSKQIRMNPDFKYVELHVHLDGSYRPETLWELAHKKGIRLKQKTFQEFKDFLHVKNSSSLKDFLVPFPTIVKIVSNDKDALNRTTFEFVEDCAKQKLCYVEARFCPQFLIGDKLTIDQVLETILTAFQNAGELYGVKIRTILSNIRTIPSWAQNMVDLAIKYKSQGVVGMDLAGDEEQSIKENGTNPQILAAFQRAKELGIHRTVHAGENGPVESIREAINKMYAQRIGHGYAIVKDLNYYRELNKKHIHYEVCPRSSFMTGGYRGPPKNHPLARFARDGASFSINTDDTTITDTWVQDEYNIAINDIGLTQNNIVEAQFNAARAAFLPSDEKRELLNHLWRSWYK